MSYKTPLLITGLSVLAISPVFAQDNSSQIEETIITSTKTTIPLVSALATSHVITQQDIELIQPRDLASLLGTVSGLDYRDSGGRGSASGVFVRGNVPGATLIIVDGVRTASATLGATNIDLVPIESIERIEIVKGPLSGLYGADAAGGVIQIFTKKGGNEGAKGSVKVGLGSHSLQETSISGSYGNDREQFRLDLHFEDGDGIDRTVNTAGGNGDRDGFEEVSLNFAADFILTEKLNANFRYLLSDSRTAFDNAFGNDPGLFSDNKFQNFSTGLNINHNEALSYQINVGYLVDEIISPVALPFVPPSDITTERLSLEAQMNLQLNSNSTIVTGISYYDDHVSTLTVFPVTERDNVGVFSQWIYDNNAISFIANFRFDDNEAYGNNSSGSLAAGYDFTDNLELVFSYGNSFRAPNFNELYFPNFGNPAVLPEESDSFELSLNYQNDHFDARLSAYKTDVDNLIAFDSSLADFANGIFGLANNIQEASLDGIELEFSTIIYHWHLSSHIDYLDARNETTNSDLTDRARTTANLAIHRKINNFNVGIDLQSESGRVDSNQTLGGYGIVGFNFDHQVTDGFSWALRVDNLFDKNYAINLAGGINNPFSVEGTTFKVSARLAF